MPVAEVRFNCLRLIERPELDAGAKVYLRSFSLHRRSVPWE